MSSSEEEQQQQQEQQNASNKLTPALAALKLPNDCVQRALILQLLLLSGALLPQPVAAAARGPASIHLARDQGLIAASVKAALDQDPVAKMLLHQKSLRDAETWLRLNGLDIVGHNESEVAETEGAPPAPPLSSPIPPPTAKPSPPQPQHDNVAPFFSKGLSAFFGSPSTSSKETPPHLPSKPSVDAPRPAAPVFVPSFNPFPLTDTTSSTTKPGHLFLANIPYSTNNDSLQALLAPFGPVSCRIVRDRQGASRGFGFADFKYEADAKAAINTLHGSVFDSRTLAVRWGDERDKLGDDYRAFEFEERSAPPLPLPNGVWSNQQLGHEDRPAFPPGGWNDQQLGFEDRPALHLPPPGRWDDQQLELALPLDQRYGSNRPPSPRRREHSRRSLSPSPSSHGSHRHHSSSHLHRRTEDTTNLAPQAVAPKTTTTSSSTTSLSHDKDRAWVLSLGAEDLATLRSLWELAGRRS
ncbi:hypothetical protein BCR35DRAFT_328997 [Leucosporidium creatinivorum]|uniref:RRM domain-containing protein n=1 Tax=Leucosporidium creatinivorum TaxID=106004 RepID=A0A1Y2FZI8_9BASI|nr:hypothetical protein BCR35DRAFT_328997 [Leucosporidium creatinivorum]